jgi:dipeptidyl aminopeptidase/acylaminoacyl peptidase
VSCTKHFRHLFSIFALSLPLFAAAAPPPVEAFFEPATIQQVAVSPSGRWMAVLNGAQGARNKLTMIDLDGKEQSKIIATFNRFDIRNFRWVGENYLIFNVVDFNDASGEQRYPGLISVDRSGTRIRELIKRKFDSLFPAGGNHPLEPYNFFIAQGAAGSDEIIVGENHFAARDYTRTHVTLRAMNVGSGAVRTIDADPGRKVVGWTIDGKGQPRVAVAQQDGENLLFWADANGHWKQIATFPRLRVPFWPEYVDDKDQLFVSVPSGPGGTEAIHKFDFATGKPFPDAIVETPNFDSEVKPIRDPGSNVIAGLVTLSDSRGMAWLTPQMQQIQKSADELLPGRVNLLTCHPCSNPRAVLVHSYSDTSPGDYLLYTPADKQWQRIGTARPAIDETKMANLDMHMAKTRDGANLPVWITALPDKDSKPRPAVVLVHGGPWVRGVEWAWDAEAQFLASRGYVVIEPEFRGSAGYGRRHQVAGWKQWGQRMQDDVTDALKFAIDKGIVDGKRVCIAGGSYGGYSTLMGLAKTPEQYRCGVAWVAVTDPRYMYTVHWSDITDDGKKYSMPEMIGDLEKDAAMLQANAPIQLASQIKAPVLLAYGARDRRVPLVHGEDMRKALIDSGAKPQWIVYDDEAHGWERPQNKIDFWRRVEAFLATNLK